jgi:hypothetical protein
MQKLKDMCSIWEPVGSRVTCRPPPTDTDNDTLCLLKEPKQLLEFVGEAVKQGFDYRGSIVEDANHQSLRFVSLLRASDNENIIVTTSPEFAQRFLAATHVAKQLNLLVKAHRVLVFQAVLYGNSYWEV